MTSLNKRELLIAQKAHLSRQVKLESAQSPSHLSTPGLSMGRSPSRSRSKGPSDKLPDISSPVPLSKSMSSLFSPSSSLSPQNQETFADFGPGRAQTAFAPSQSQSQSQSLDCSEYSELISEIKQRSLTPFALIRKYQATIAKDLKSPENMSSINASENRYMPKVSLLRPDGSSLTDIYSSKREDMWAKIMKAQLAEEEEQKARDRQAKLKAHEDFGAKLKQQVDDYRERAKQVQSMDKIYANSEPETTKKMAEAQAKRDAVAAESRKQFIVHALEDAKVARERRERALRQEIEDSQVMVMKAKALIAEEERQRELKKMKEAERLARLAAENVENINRRAEERKRKQEEEKRAVWQAQKASMDAEARRKEDVLNISNRVALGPAYKIATELHAARVRQEQQMYESIAKAENCLNRQLQTSEQAACARANSDTQYLVNDWTQQIRIHKEEAKADADRIEKIGEVMKQTIKQMEIEDEINRQKKRDAHMKYQRDLDAQLANLRARSIKSLQETMTPAEVKYNSDLIRKTIKYSAK